MKGEREPNPGFGGGWGGVLGMAMLIGLVSMQPLVRALRGMDKIMEGFHTDFVLKAIREDTVVSFLPVFSVLPFAASYLEDIKSKFARFFLVRSSYRGYLLSRLSVCFCVDASLHRSGKAETHYLTGEDAE